MDGLIRSTEKYSSSGVCVFQTTLLRYTDFVHRLLMVWDVNINTKNLPADKHKRREQILKNIDTKHISSFARKELEKLLLNFEDIFNLEGEPLTTNTFYSQNINLTDNTPVYIPSTEQYIHKEKK